MTRFSSSALRVGLDGRFCTKTISSSCKRPITNFNFGPYLLLDEPEIVLVHNRPSKSTAQVWHVFVVNCEDFVDAE